MKKKMKTQLIGLTVIALASAVGINALAGEHGEKKVKLPAAVVAAVVSNYPAADITKYGQEEIALTVYEEELMENGQEISVIIAEDGTIVSAETVIDAKALPKAANAAIAAKAKGSAILKAEKEVKYTQLQLTKLPASETSYEAFLALDGEKYEIVVDSQGKLISMKEAEEDGDKADMNDEDNDKDMDKNKDSDQEDND